MAFRNTKDLIEAVFFFGRKGVTKQMRYTEFEAVLDGVVGVTGLSSREVQAAYLRITPTLEIHSVVLFLIEFDDRGFADQDWNIPLRHLADTAGPGPDLGRGPIRLACRSQCSVSWYQKELWEPTGRDGLNHFKLIQDAVRTNKLGIITDQPVFEPPVIHEKVTDEVDYDQVPTVSETVEPSALAGYSEDELKQKLAEQAEDYQSKLAVLSQRQKQRLQGLEEQHKEALDQVKRAMRNEAQAYRNRIQELEQQANQNKVLLEKLQSRHTKLEKDYLLMQETNDTQKDRFDELKEEHLELLRNQQKTEAGETLKLTELKELLTEKNFEIDELKEQLRRLTAENLDIKGQLEEADKEADTTDVEAVFERLESLELVFVAYHPGAGHISLPARQLSDYLERPLVFAAQKCGVTLEHYKAWLVHYDNPECEQCGVPVKRIDQPADYEPGSHNFCTRHRLVTGNVAAFRKSS
ncbi:MAG: hypothetical protein ACX931_05550 [Saccharospirillum sp.]